jgi:predicted nucleic acid-binding Zn ribbon protein
MSAMTNKADDVPMYCVCCECKEKMEVFFVAQDYSSVVCDKCISPNELVH